jgi:Secretion system C-terminal sorting domain/Fibronectin type III domain
VRITANEISPLSSTILNCNLPAATNLAILNVTTNSVSASWDPVTDATQYRVMVAEILTNYITYSGVTANTNILVPGLNSGTKYRIRIYGIDNTGCESPNSADADFFTPFIITDEVVFEMPVPDIYTDGTPVNLPVNFKLCTLTETDLSFSLSMDGDKLKVKYDNNSADILCSNGWPEFYLGWQLGNQKDAPLVDNGKSTIDATLINCYTVTNALGPCAQQGNPALILAVDRVGNQVNLIRIGGFSKKNCNLYYQSQPKDGENTLRNNGAQTSTNGLQIAPNPFNDVLTFNFESNDEDPVNVQLISINGKVVRSETFQSQLRNGAFSTDDLTKGVYFLKMETSKETKTFKVVKVN